MAAHSLEINHLHICSLLNCDLFLLYHHQRKKEKISVSKSKTGDKF